MFKAAGPQSILRAIQSFRPEDIDPEIAARVKEILDQNDRNKVRSHSAGAATIFVWVSEKQNPTVLVLAFITVVCSQLILDSTICNILIVSLHFAYRFSSQVFFSCFI